jgi:hypothetical protein
MRRRAAAWPAAACLLLATAACAGDESGEETSPTSAGASAASIRLVIPDNNIRAEGVECAGARPFEDIHAGAAYSFEAADGTEIVAGTLPAGRAENAEPGTDWGVEEIPTVCVMLLELPEVPEAEGYRLRLPGDRALEFEGRYLTPGEPLELLVQ